MSPKMNILDAHTSKRILDYCGNLRLRRFSSFMGCVVVFLITPIFNSYKIFSFLKLSVVQRLNECSVKIDVCGKYRCTVNNDVLDSIYGSVYVAY